MKIKHFVFGLIILLGGLMVFIPSSIVLPPGDVFKAHLLSFDTAWQGFYADDERKIDQPQEFEFWNNAKQDLKELHSEWRRDFEYLIGESVSPEEFVPGTMYQSGIHYDGYQTEFERSLDLVKKLNRELDQGQRRTCEICQKQKGSLKCEGC